MSGLYILTGLMGKLGTRMSAGGEGQVTWIGGTFQAPLGAERRREEMYEMRKWECGRGNFKMCASDTAIPPMST